MHARIGLTIFAQITTSTGAVPEDTLVAVEFSLSSELAIIL